MKYTEEQIYKGFERWLTERRLYPSRFKSDEDELAEDITDLSADQTKALIIYINK